MKRIDKITDIMKAQIIMRGLKHKLPVKKLKICIRSLLVKF